MKKRTNLILGKIPITVDSPEDLSIINRNEIVIKPTSDNKVQLLTLDETSGKRKIISKGYNEDKFKGYIKVQYSKLKFNNTNREVYLNEDYNIKVTISSKYPTYINNVRATYQQEYENYIQDNLSYSKNKRDINFAITTVLPNINNYLKLRCNIQNSDKYYTIDLYKYLKGKYVDNEHLTENVCLIPNHMLIYPDGRLEILDEDYHKTVKLVCVNYSNNKVIIEKGIVVGGSKKLNRAKPFLLYDSRISNIIENDSSKNTTAIVSEALKQERYIFGYLTGSTISVYNCPVRI